MTIAASPGGRADPETLMRQASWTAKEYLYSAIADINGRLGEGYAEAHPELVGAYIQTAALDYGASMISRAIEIAGETISDALMRSTD
jgi:hypothetical protein